VTGTSPHSMDLRGLHVNQAAPLGSNDPDKTVTLSDQRALGYTKLFVLLLESGLPSQRRHRREWVSR